MTHIPNDEANPFHSLADLILNNKSIAVLATAVEKIDIYCWDRFGRFIKAEKLDKNNALDLLADLYKWEGEQEPPFQQNPLEVDYQHPLYLYGWAKDVLPNFEDISKTLGDVKPPVRRSAETNRLTSRLVLIAALCKHFDVVLENRGIAQRLVEMTERLGSPIDSDTITTIIKEIPDAVDRKGK